MNEVINYSGKLFEQIKHIDEENREYWLARELYKILEYSTWQKFVSILEKAKEACTNSDVNIDDNFNHVVKIVKTGVAFKKIDDYKLSRYACYLIVQNCDPRKKIVALAQTYFAIQTRKQELLEEYEENKKRLMRRNDLTRANKNLSGIAKVPALEIMESLLMKDIKVSTMGKL